MHLPAVVMRVLGRQISRKILFGHVVLVVQRIRVVNRELAQVAYFHRIPFVWLSEFSARLYAACRGVQTLKSAPNDAKPKIIDDDYNRVLYCAAASSTRLCG